MKTCVNCGCRSEDGARFCKACGAELSAAAAASTEATPAAPNAGNTGGVMSVFLKYASALNDAQLYKVAVAKEMGVVQSTPEEIAEIYRVLAFRGHLEGMYKYAEICLAGGDKLTAYKWFKVASDAGHIPSKARLNGESFADTRPTFTAQMRSGADATESAESVSGASVLENPNERIVIPEGSGDLVSAVNDAIRGVVMITAVENRGNVRMVSRGSGFIAEGGYVVTNAHVVGEDPSCVQANFEPSVDERTYNLMPLAVLPEYDIAILKFTNYKPKRIFKLRTSGVRFGESVYTVGNPLGVGLSVSKGIVSNPNRKNTFSGGDYHSRLETVIQTDIVSNHGNSGGAIFDMNNNVIAMLTFEPSKSEGGMSMCVPAQYIENVIKKIK